jgi:hypothetical protein
MGIGRTGSDKTNSKLKSRRRRYDSSRTCLRVSGEKQRTLSRGAVDELGYISLELHQIFVVHIPHVTRVVVLQINILLSLYPGQNYPSLELGIASLLTVWRVLSPLTMTQENR